MCGSRTLILEHQLARINGMNVHCKSERGHGIGWAPVLGMNAFLAGVEVDLQTRLEY